MKLIALLLLPLASLAIAPTLAEACPTCAEHGAMGEDKADKKADKKEGKEAPKEEVKEEAKEEAEPAKATIGKKAPAFTLKNAEGKEVKLADYAGKTVVLEWINLDCPWCKAHYEKGDALVKLQKEVRDNGGEWLLICSSGAGKQGNFDAETLKKRLDKVGLKGDVYLHDTDGAVGKKYDAKTTPHAFVIDGKGILRYAGALDNLPDQRRGDEPVNYVSQTIEAIRAEKEVAKTEVKPYG